MIFETNQSFQLEQKKLLLLSLWSEEKNELKLPMLRMKEVGTATDREEEERVVVNVGEEEG